MRDRIIAFLLFAFTLISSDAIADEAWGFARLWIGKYPSADAGVSKGGLLAQPQINRVMEKILPKAERASLSRLDVEAPVREIDGFIVVNKCRPHNCPSESASIVIDARSGHLWVGFFFRAETNVVTRWYGEDDDYTVLPESVRKDFSDRHAM